MKLVCRKLKDVLLYVDFFFQVLKRNCFSYCCNKKYLKCIKYLSIILSLLLTHERYASVISHEPNF